jgi:DNA-directed RNA polymerase specialized sigma24 family protein
MCKNRGWRIERYDIEDIVHDAYMHAMNKQIEIDSQLFVGYLVINVLRFVQKRGKSKLAYTTTEILNKNSACDSIDSEYKDDLDKLYVSINSLPYYLKRDVKQFLSGLSTAEIATNNNMKRETISVNLCRAKDILANLMQNKAN